MRAPVRPATALALVGARLLAATWRFRRVGGPPLSVWPREDREGGERLVRARRVAARLPVACYACWHEHQLPLAFHHRGQGIVALVSRHRDGEIVARVLRRLGYAVARGSSSRGGAGGLRRMIRTGREGRPLAFTPDGPRGPARVCKSGIVRAAARTGLPVIPVGVAARPARRLESWDRFLVPAPWARVVVSYGPPIRVPPAASRDPERWRRHIGGAIDREVQRCEEALRARAALLPQHRGARERVELRVRSAWTGRPGPALRAAGAAFAFAAEARRLAYDAGILREWRPPLPVVSVGGLTVGGSGKTPVTAELANWLAAGGHRVAILTRGFADELALHGALAPEAPAIGDRDRYRAAVRAARAGATVALLDDGFQHRRLARDLEIVLVDLDALLRTNLHRLPAGPFRERFGAVARAEALVITRRGAAEHEAQRLEAWLRRRLPGRPVARLAFRPGELLPANARARAAASADPAVAVCGIMKPELFFEQAVRRSPGLDGRLVLPDHAPPSPEQVEACVRAAGSRGVVCTRKDLFRLAPVLPDTVPLWYLEDRLQWEAGEEELRRLVHRVAERADAIRNGERAPAGSGGARAAAEPDGATAASGPSAGPRCAS